MHSWNPHKPRGSRHHFVTRRLKSREERPLACAFRAFGSGVEPSSLSFFRDSRFSSWCFEAAGASAACPKQWKDARLVARQPELAVNASWLGFELCVPPSFEIYFDFLTFLEHR